MKKARPEVDPVGPWFVFVGSDFAQYPAFWTAPYFSAPIFGPLHIFLRRWLIGEF